MIASLGKKVVTTAGTPVQLTTLVQGMVAQRVRITAEHDNTGRIYVGLAGMVVSTGVQVIGVIGIPPGASAGEIPCFDFGVSGNPGGIRLSDLWIDSTVNGDGVFIAYA